MLITKSSIMPDNIPLYENIEIDGCNQITIAFSRSEKKSKKQQKKIVGAIAEYYGMRINTSSDEERSIFHLVP